MPVETINDHGEEYVKMPKKEFEQWKATVELAKRNDLQNKLAQSREQYDEGKSKSWDEVKDDL
jgi:PHD/YefM family antitoxin component YafN of YafNO toxin-antitoxin module